MANFPISFEAPNYLGAAVLGSETLLPHLLRNLTDSQLYQMKTVCRCWQKIILENTFLQAKIQRGRLFNHICFLLESGFETKLMRVKALSSLALKQLKIDPARSALTFAKASESVELCLEIFARVQALCSVAVKKRKSDLEGAKRMVCKALEEAGEISQDFGRTDYCYSMIVESESKFDPVSSLRNLEKISEDRRDQIFSKIAHRIYKAFRQTALDRARAISESCYRVQAIRKIAQHEIDGQEALLLFAEAAKENGVNGGAGQPLEYCWIAEGQVRFDPSAALTTLGFAYQCDEVSATQRAHDLFEIGKVIEMIDPSAVLPYYCEAFEKAIEAAEKMPKKEFLVWGVPSLIVKAIAKHDLQTAINFAQRYPEKPFFKEFVLSIMAEIQAKNDLIGALKSAEKIEHPSYRMQAFCSIPAAAGMAAPGAVLLFEKALEEVARISVNDPDEVEIVRVSNMGAIALRIAKIDPARAIEVLQEAFTMAEKIDNPDRRGVALEKVADFLAEAFV